MPIACVDFVPVRRNHAGAITDVGLIKRTSQTRLRFPVVRVRALFNRTAFGYLSADAAIPSPFTAPCQSSLRKR